MPNVLPDPNSDFGQRVRSRLREERVIWFVSMGADGTPAPNPVWFLWEDPRLLVYSGAGAHRLRHIARNPNVALHFNSTREGGDIVVLRGVARAAPDHPAADAYQPYLDKYEASMVGVSGDIGRFARDYSVPLLIDVAGVRGF